MKSELEKILKALHRLKDVAYDPERTIEEIRLMDLPSSIEEDEVEEDQPTSADNYGLEQRVSQLELTPYRPYLLNKSELRRYYIIDGTSVGLTYPYPYSPSSSFPIGYYIDEWPKNLYGIGNLQQDIIPNTTTRDENCNYIPTIVYTGSNAANYGPWWPIPVVSEGKYPNGYYQHGCYSFFASVNHNSILDRTTSSTFGYNYVISDISNDIFNPPVCVLKVLTSGPITYNNTVSCRFLYHSANIIYQNFSSYTEVTNGNMDVYIGHKENTLPGTKNYYPNPQSGDYIVAARGIDLNWYEIGSRLPVTPGSWEAAPAPQSQELKLDYSASSGAPGGVNGTLWTLDTDT